MAKRCFVIQGFGKKQGYEQGKQFNLDASYDVIKEATRDAGMECYRADELRTSGTIDQVMYDQLLSADLVVADITTLNFNAAFELGVRLALRTNTHLEDAMEMEGSLMKPRLFIGSSSEKLLYAYALQNQLKSEADWGKLEKMDTKVYDKQQTEVSEWKRSHTASTPRNCARRPYDL